MVRRNQNQSVPLRRRDVLTIDLVSQVRRMLGSHSLRVVGQISFQVHPDRDFWLTSVDEATLGLLEVLAIQIMLALIHRHLWHALRVVLPCHLERRMPILLMLIHRDRLRRLVCLYIMLLRFLESTRIFQMQRIFQMHILQLILRMRLSQTECFFKLLLRSFEFNRCVQQS